MPDRAGLTPHPSPEPELDSGTDSARVFFALWPDDAVRKQLDDAAGLLHRLRGGRRTRADTLHLTLVFLGNVPHAELDRLKACATVAQGTAFEVVFDHADCWRHNRIAHLAASQPPQALLDLVAGLENALSDAGFHFDRRPYKAHVTLVRHADCRKTNPALGPIRWPVRDFVLVESSLRPEGARYEVLARYPLA